MTAERVLGASAPNKDAFCITKCVSCQFPSEIGSQDDSRETSFHSQKDVKQSKSSQGSVKKTE